MLTQTDAVSTGSAHEVDLKLAAKVAAGGHINLSPELGEVLGKQRRHTTGSCVKDAAVQHALCRAIGPKCQSS